MFDLSFSVLEGGLPQEGRVVVLFRYITEAKLVRSGMLNFDVRQNRFVGPQRSPELLDAALDYLRRAELAATMPEQKTA
jgi:hypothetical protein